jgi:hypothetical protein
MKRPKYLANVSRDDPRWTKLQDAVRSSLNDPYQAFEEWFQPSLAGHGPIRAEVMSEAALAFYAGWDAGQKWRESVVNNK